MDAATLLRMTAALLLGVAALHDIAVRTVPNALIGTLCGCGLLLAVSQGRLASSLAVAALMLAFTGILWARGYFGGADAKLMVAAALLVAPGSVPAMLAAVSLAGGLLCLPYLPGQRLIAAPARRRPSTIVSRLLRCERWRLRRRGPLPYAVAIATGTIFVLLHGA